MSVLNDVWGVLISLWNSLNVKVPPFNFTFQEMAIGTLMLCWGVSFVSYLLHADVKGEDVKNGKRLKYK